MAWSSQLSAYMTKSAVVQSAKTKIGTGAEKELLVVKNRKSLVFRISHAEINDLSLVTTLKGSLLNSIY